LNIGFNIPSIPLRYSLDYFIFSFKRDPCTSPSLDRYSTPFVY